MTRRGLRFAFVVLVVVFVAAIVAPPGIAGTVSVASGTLSYSGGGTMNVTIDFVEPLITLRYYRVVDSGGVIAGTSCTQTSPTEARCITGIGGVPVSAIDVDGTSGNDTITLTAAVAVPATILANQGADTVTGGSGNDYVSDELIQPTSGGSCFNFSDVLNGGAGNDTLRGCLGSDTLNGGPGNDDLADSDGFGQTDTFNGGTEDDLINSRDADGDAVDCGLGQDRLRENATDSRIGCELFFPRNTAQPTISGTAREGETLTASPGTWTGTQPISFAYQWRRCTDFGLVCSDIAGATGVSYTAGADDVNRVLEIVVTASNSAGSDPWSAQTSTVTASSPRNTAPPTISGTPRVGETLTTSNGVWAMTKQPITGFTHQWRRCAADGSGCTDIGGATAQAYSVTGADVGASLRSVVTATNSVGSTASTSAHVFISAAPPPGGSSFGDCTINGTSGNDTLVGTPRRDVICAGAGKDVVRGLGGNDVIRLGAGNDKGYGGAGKDRILGGKGRDRLVGGKGRDTLNGGPGRDICIGLRDVKRSC